MRTYRATISTFTLMLLVLTAGIPASASAGLLLSGYGGPGQGSQSILGTALLGVPSGGTGGGSGGGGAAEGAGTSSSAATTSGAPTGAAGGAKSPVRKSSTKRQSGSSIGTAGRPSGNAAQGSAGTYSSSQAGGGGTPTLGLSGADLRDVLLALAALAVTGALTAQLARRAG
jgi:fibronectin-binding autotransporter adhesin